MTAPSHEDTKLRDIVVATLADHPVSVGFLFGSRARGNAHDRSDIDEELKARKRSDETMAEVIARHLYRPHPAETRDILTGEESEAVEDAIDGLYGTDESDRLGRARRSQYRERV